MTRSASIATLTMNPALDESTRVIRVEPGRKLRCSDPVFHPGGGGINVARAIRNLGGTAIAVVACGGPVGRRLEELLRRQGVDVRIVPIGGCTRENLNVVEETTGLQFRFCKPGPPLLESEWRSCLEALESLLPVEYVVLSGSLPPGVPADFYLRAASLVQSRGTRVVLDASGEALKLGLQAGIFLLKASLSEFESLVGQAAPSEERWISAARRLIDDGRCEALLLSLGPGGVLWVSARDAGRIPAIAVPVASEAGAGDSLVAGVVLELSRGAALRDAVHSGVAAGSAAVMNAGTELCKREDVDRLLERLRTVSV